MADKRCCETCRWWGQYPGYDVKYGGCKFPVPEWILRGFREVEGQIHNEYFRPDGALMYGDDGVDCFAWQPQKGGEQ